jgi:hypothetical protein
MEKGKREPYDVTSHLQGVFPNAGPLGKNENKIREKSIAFY